MNYVMLVQSTDKLASATHGLYTLYQIVALFWMSFYIISVQWTAPGFCHCTCPLGSCRGETGEGRPNGAATFDL